MNTWFHGVANVTIGHGLQRRAPWLRLRTVFLSSLLPDAPLFVLTIWYFFVHGFGFGARYDDLFYNEPLWIISHNMFHAPLVIASIAAAGLVLWFAKRRHSPVGASRRDGNNEAKGGAVLLSVAFGTGLHSLADVFTHHDDGPLLLFPVNMELRFSSPVSYWDPEHYGLVVLAIETALMVLMGVYWLVRRRRQRRLRDQDYARAEATAAAAWRR